MGASRRDGQVGPTAGLKPPSTPTAYAEEKKEIPLPTGQREEQAQEEPVDLEREPEDPRVEERL